MKLETTRFGTLDIDPKAIITFTQPILGFQEYRRFILHPGPSEHLTWLQSTDSAELAFILMDPKAIVTDYEIDLKENELSELAVSDVAELDIYTLIVVPQDPAKVRTNLRAPILINARHKLGKQTILERSNYPIQFFLAQATQPEPQEVTHARSDA